MHVCQSGGGIGHFNCLQPKMLDKSPWRVWTTRLTNVGPIRSSLDVGIPLTWETLPILLAIVWCLEPPIARFGSLILKVVIVPTPSFHSTNQATDGFGYCFPRLSHFSSKFILLISPSLLNGFAPFNL